MLFTNKKSSNLIYGYGFSCSVVEDDEDFPTEGDASADEDHGGGTPGKEFKIIFKILLL